MLRAKGISVSTVIVLEIGIVLAAAAHAQPTPAQESSPLRRNALLERLVRIPGQVQVLQSSSHNKQGHNGDANMPLYKDAKGDDVIFDAAGPGCIRSKQINK